MKTLFYAVCTIPAICVLISWLTPNDFNRGGPAVTMQFALLGIIAIACPVLTLMGIGCIVAWENKIAAIIATVIAALPGIYVLIAIHLARGPF
jgi:hypothetical protein